MSTLDRPILIIGAARSGTEMIGEILARHPAVAYWLEPKYIWRYGDPRSETDVRTAADATEPVVAYIRRRFERFTERHGRPRFMEKTPSNCLRVPFLDRVFPDARFLHIVRDGRDVAASAAKKWSSPPYRPGLWRRLRSMEIPLRDAPFYGTDFLRDVIGRQLRPASGLIWGPHTPGLRAIRRQRSLLETCAIQWRECVEASLRDLAAIDPRRVHTLRFEDLVAEPEAGVGRLLEFTQLPGGDEVVAFARDYVRPEVAYRWRGRGGSTWRELLPEIGGTLERLGYPEATVRASVAGG